MTIKEQLTRLSPKASRKIVYQYHDVTILKFEEQEICAMQFQAVLGTEPQRKSFFGFDIVEDPYNGTIRIQMNGNNPSLILFSSLCEFILEKASLIQRVDYNFILNAINEWIEFGKSQEIYLKPSFQFGLFGELLLLKELITELGPQIALTSWQGPARNKVDFVISESLAIEVKSSSDPLSAKVTISSIEQLSSQYNNHILRRYALIEVTNGQTLLELYKSIIDELTDFYHREIFRQKIIEYGVNPFFNYSNLISLRMALFNDYDVNEPEFPKISGPIHASIVKLNYVIKLDHQILLDKQYCLNLLRKELQ